jgi:hypothetical protein
MAEDAARYGEPQAYRRLHAPPPTRPRAHTSLSSPITHHPLTHARTSLLLLSLSLCVCHERGWLLVRGFGSFAVRTPLIKRCMRWRALPPPPPPPPLLLCAAAIAAGPLARAVAALRPPDALRFGMECLEKAAAQRGGSSHAPVAPAGALGVRLGPALGWRALEDGAADGDPAGEAGGAAAAAAVAVPLPLSLAHRIVMEELSRDGITSSPASRSRSTAATGDQEIIGSSQAAAVAGLVDTSQLASAGFQAAAQRWAPEQAGGEAAAAAAEGGWGGVEVGVRQRLQRRFPGCSPASIDTALRASHDHAGRAAALLRRSPTIRAGRAGAGGLHFISVDSVPQQ